MIIGWRSIGYFTRAVARKAWRLVTRQTLLVSQEEEYARSRKCSECLHRIGSQCEICTCFISGKILWVDEVCPAKPPKW